MATAAEARFEEMRKRGDQSEAVLFGLGVALFAQIKCHAVQVDLRSGDLALHRRIEALKPLATSPDGSRRIKLEYADFLDYLSHLQPGVVVCIAGWLLLLLPAIIAGVYALGGSKR